MNNKAINGAGTDYEDFIVCKFGGTSVANAEQISKIENIIRENKQRRFVVVSAPGKDSKFKYKVTDILYNLYFSMNSREDDGSIKYESIEGTPGIFQDMLVERFSKIASDLGVKDHIIEDLKAEIVLKDIVENKYLDQVVYLGEYFSARIFANYAGFNFADTADIIKMRSDGSVIMDTTLSNIKSLRSLSKVTVIPGFYGSTGPSENIRTFSRGGSDLTGSLVAAGIDVKLYENWTDRDGIYACDPKLFGENELPNGLFIIPKMSYKETRELTYMGFEVFNDESIGPLVGKKIPLIIKNTNNPSAPGTFISEGYDSSMSVRGIAGRNGFCSINIEKYMMNKIVGFGSKLFNILSNYGLNFEHAPSGIDSMSVVLEQRPFEKYRTTILDQINKTLEPDNINVKEHLGLVAIVGEGMKGNCAINSTIMRALADNNIATEIISQGASENNLILGINTSDYQRAIKSLYLELIEKNR